LVGTKGYKQFPIWGRVLGNNLVQVVTPYELEMFKEQTKIVIPQELQRRMPMQIQSLLFISWSTEINISNVSFMISFDK